MNDLLGQLGQDEFKRWCTKEGMIASPPTPDRMGWDFFVEWKPEDQHGPLDGQNDLPKAIVQIKSTTSRVTRKSVAVKLSALKNLVDADLPTFIVHLQYRRQKLFNARLLHIGESEIERVLKRTREAENRQEPLHKVSLSLPLSTSQVIELDGSNIREHLENHIDGTLINYILRKKEIVKTCGFGSHPYTMNLKIQSSLSELEDQLLGMGPSLEISDAKITTQRFGIKLPSDTNILGHGKLTITPSPTTTCRATLTDEWNVTKFQTELDLYVSPLLQKGRKNPKIRVSNHFIEILTTAESEEIECTTSFSMNEKYSFAKLQEIIHFTYWSTGGDVTLKVNAAEQSLFTAKLEGNAEDHKAWRSIYLFSQLVHEGLQSSVGLGLPHLSLKELDAQLEKNFTEFILLTEKGPTYRAKLDPHFDRAQIEKGVVFFYPITLDFPTFTYGALIRYTNETPVIEDGNLQIQFQNPTIIHSHVSFETPSNTLEHLTKMTPKYIQREDITRKAIISYN